MSWIGKWAQRVRTGTRRRTTKAHLIDSEKPFADPPYLVTRCGRDMDLSTSRGELEEFIARENVSRCVTCLARGS